MRGQQVLEHVQEFAWARPRFLWTVLKVPPRSGLGRGTPASPRARVGDRGLLSTIAAEDICAGEASAQKILRDGHI